MTIYEESLLNYSFNRNRNLNLHTIFVFFYLRIRTLGEFHTFLYYFSLSIVDSPTSVKSMRTHNNFSTVRVSRSQALDTLQDPTVRDHSLVESPGSSDIDRRNGRDDNETRDVVKCSEAIAKSKDRGTVCERINELETRIRTETNSDDYRL